MAIGAVYGFVNQRGKKKIWSGLEYLRPGSITRLCTIKTLLELQLHCSHSMLICLPGLVLLLSCLLLGSRNAVRAIYFPPRSLSRCPSWLDNNRFPTPEPVSKVSKGGGAPFPTALGHFASIMHMVDAFSSSQLMHEHTHTHTRRERARHHRWMSLSSAFQISEEVSSIPRLADQLTSVPSPLLNVSKPNRCSSVCLCYSAADWRKSETTQRGSSNTSREVSAPSFVLQCSLASSSGMCAK